MANQADFKFTLTADPGFNPNHSRWKSQRNFNLCRPWIDPRSHKPAGAATEQSVSANRPEHPLDDARRRRTITLPATGYTWTGNVSGNWDTTSVNWSGPGTIYVDNTATSDVIFGDGPTRTTISVPTAVNPHSMTFSNATASYTFGGSAINVAAGISKTGAGSLAFNNAVSAASVGMSGGTTTIGGGGTLTSPLINVGSSGTLIIANGGALAATSGLAVNGNVTFNIPTQTLATLGGGSSGVLTLNGTVLNVSAASSYDGKITGTGSIVKNTGGTLTLNGSNDFTGGITISSGAVQLGGATAGGTAPVVVNAGGILAMAVSATPSTNAVILNGGIVGSIGNQTVNADVTVNSASSVSEFNPISNTTGADFIITGMLSGSGNIAVLTQNGNAPDSSAVRLRGPVSNYSGTITVPQSGKFELQTTVNSGSQMGTGTLIVTGGTTTATNAGTYSIINVRNNSAAGLVSDVDFGNNVQVTGTGSSFFNLLGSAPAGSTVKFGDLLIGDGQAIGAVATGSQAYTVAFNTVHLNGGMITFTPQPVGNANFVSIENISLGTVTQDSPSGITMNGAATLTFAGAATYTGATVINSGTVMVAASITGSSGVAVNGGTLGGGGAIASPVIVGDNDPAMAATINPGGMNEIGTLTVGPASFNNSDAQFQIELNSNDLTADRLTVNGALSLGNALAQFFASDLGFGTLTQGERFVIATATGGITGSFNSYPQGSTMMVGTNPLTISYLNSQITLTAVPESTSVITLLGGLAALGGRRRLSRKCLNGLN